jgi:alpha-1,6-mannosyltransferase
MQRSPHSSPALDPLRHFGVLSLATCAATCTLVYAAVYRLPGFVALGPLRNLAATLLASLPFLLAVLLAERRWPGGAAEAGSPEPLRAPGASRAGTGLDRASMTLLIGGAMAMRVALPGSAIVASDDAYRYVWDGKVQAAGINPYAYAPDARELTQLTSNDHFRPKIYRPDMRTVYPPLAQLWFWLAYLLGGVSFVGLKTIFLLHEAAAVFLLLLLLRRRGLPAGRALIYAWSPLAVVQGFAGNHLDILLVPWLFAALLAADDHPFFSGAALGASAMIRPVTALGGPALALRRPLRETVQCGAGFVVACLVLALPYASIGLDAMTESLRTYGQHWQFNGSLFRLLDAVLNQWAPFRPTLYGAIALCGLAAGFLPVGRDTRLAAGIGVYFALAPTVYPWYLLSVLAVTSVSGGAFPVALPALITLADLVFVDGAVGGRWEVPRPALWIEYVGLYGLVAYRLIAHFRRNRSRAAS